MTFQKKLLKIQLKNSSLVCIGLDPKIGKIPQFLFKKFDPIFEFNKSIIDNTYDLVCGFKPNIAFYEVEGIKGLKSLQKTINYLKSSYPYIPIILDAKRGDIASTSQMYAQTVFTKLKVDAVTAFAYLGYDSVKPFLNFKDKFTFFMVKNSNPDAIMFQDLKLANGQPYYLAMAEIMQKWPEKNFGPFCGATFPKELQKIRSIFPKRPILTAGIGAQGGNVKLAVQAGIDKKGLNLICNSSRSIIYAKNDRDFALKARERTNKIKNTINKYRSY